MKKLHADMLLIRDRVAEDVDLWARQYYRSLAMQGVIDALSLSTALSAGLVEVAGAIVGGAYTTMLEASGVEVTQEHRKAGFEPQQQFLMAYKRLLQTLPSDASPSISLCEFTNHAERIAELEKMLRRWSAAKSTPELIELADETSILLGDE